MNCDKNDNFRSANNIAIQRLSRPYDSEKTTSINRLLSRIRFTFPYSSILHSLADFIIFSHFLWKWRKRKKVLFERNSFFSVPIVSTLKPNVRCMHACKHLNATEFTWWLVNCIKLCCILSPAVVVFLFTHIILKYLQLNCISIWLCVTPLDCLRFAVRRCNATKCKKVQPTGE